MPHHPADDTVPIRLGTAARAWRAALAGGLALMFVLGSLLGADDWWPFSPWRMFATATAPSGAVVTLSIERQVAGDPTWTPAPLTLDRVGLNRAEVEGRVPQIVRDPAMLGTLARTHARLHPDAPDWTAVRVVRSLQVLRDRRPTGEVRREVVATWRAGSGGTVGGPVDGAGGTSGGKSGRSG